MKKLLFISLLFLVGVAGFAQPDTIIVYNVPTQTVNTILPLSFDTTATFDNTSSSIGSFGSQVPLSLTPPTVNLFNGSNFSDIERAELFHTVTDYPIRTAIKLFGWLNDTLEHGCSAIMVGENLVLTAAHCIQSLTTQDWLFDSILVAPAYDNGTIQLTLPTSIVDKYYVFKSFYYHTAFDDIALLQLRQPIGQQIGWAGIAFSSDTSYFSGKVFHKFSYPSVVSPFDSSKVYNGDTLYYNYGYIGIVPFNNLGVNSPQALGIPGQSGSSFLYTDNFDYYSFGVFTFSSNYRHYQITRNVFNRLKNIMDNYAVSIQDKIAEGNSIKVYPNPTSGYFYIQGSFALPAVIELYDLTGRQVYRKPIKSNFQQINVANLAAGLYIYRLLSDGKQARGEIILE